MHHRANRSEHPVYKRFASQGIVTYRKQFARTTQQHLVMREQSGKPDAVHCGSSSGNAFDSRSRFARSPRRLIFLARVMELDDLYVGEKARRFLREAHHERGARPKSLER